MSDFEEEISRRRMAVIMHPAQQRRIALIRKFIPDGWRFGFSFPHRAVNGSPVI